jgi:hypothetical protein
MEKPTVGFPFFGEFPSDRNSKGTKDAKIYLFIDSFILRGNDLAEKCKLYMGMAGTF